MEANIIDLLTCLESSEKFEQGLGDLDSPEKISKLKQLPESLLPSYSKRWNKLKTSDLEKTHETLSGIERRVTFLRQYFEGQIDYYEKGYYEIEPPHPFDVFPPNENYRSQWTGNISAEPQKEEKKESKLNPSILQYLAKVDVYLDILYSWWTGVHNQSIQVKRILDKNYIEYDMSETTDSDPQIKVCLKPVNEKNTKSGLSDLRVGLIDLKLISEETKLTDLRRLFGIGIGNVKIVWTGSKVALRYFILELERQNKIIKFTEGNKYSKVSQLFTLEKYPDYNLELLGSNNGKYAGIKTLRKAISNL